MFHDRQILRIRRKHCWRNPVLQQEWKTNPRNQTCKRQQLRPASHDDVPYELQANHDLERTVLRAKGQVWQVCPAIQSRWQQAQSNGSCLDPQLGSFDWRCCKWCRRRWRPRSPKILSRILDVECSVRESYRNHDWVRSARRGPRHYRVV